MKVVVVGTRGFPGIQGGVEAHCEQLYPRLVDRGCEIVVLTRKPYRQGTDGVYRGVQLIALGCPRNKHLEAFLHTLFGVLFARRLSPDILHVHAVGPSLFVPLARWLGMQVVMTNHGPDYERKKWGRLAKGILKLGESLGSRWSNRVICLSQSIAERVKTKCRQMPVVIPNGVEVRGIVETQGALQRYGLKPRKYILAVGRLVPEKGFHDLIEAFGQLQQTDRRVEHEGWKLVIVGCADHEDHYSQSLKHQGGTTPNVILTGFLQGAPLAELYSHAGLFVLPSSYEGLPLVLLEAMSYGLSCLVSDIPANAGVGLSAERYFRPGDIHTLAEKMRAYLAKPLSAEEKRHQTERLLELNSWETIAEGTLEVYQSVCQ